MGKLTAEQKGREHDRGQKAASEGRSRSWSEPWAYPFAALVGLAPYDFDSGKLRGHRSICAQTKPRHGGGVCWGPGSRTPGVKGGQ
jgi:hypothetical protein